MLEQLRQDSVGIFLIIVSVILFAPMLSRLLRLPGIAGLILAGMVVGPHGLGLLNNDGALPLLATVGLIYLMFGAGAEIDLAQFNRLRQRSLVFGLLTFGIPLLTGTLLGTLLGYSTVSAILLGSILASHTLIAFPILSQLGLGQHEIVSITTGATIFTDIGALLVLAVVAGSQGPGQSPLFVLQLVGLLLAYTLLILLGLPRLGRAFFHYFRGSAVEFQFVLVVIFLAAFLAERIGMEAIVGAFLAGLAINAAVPDHSEVLGRVLFVGESFFTPIFLMSIGMLVDPFAFVRDGRSLMMSGLLLLSIFSSKLLAAWFTGRHYDYGPDARWLMGGLSLAQAAATLAATLVGVQLGLLEPYVFNGVISMILITCVASPLIVERSAKRLLQRSASSEPEAKERKLFKRLLVAVSNPQSGAVLLTLAEGLTQAEAGQYLSLHVSQLGTGQGSAQPEIYDKGAVQIHRVDSSIANGILSTLEEQSATALLMGWGAETTIWHSITGSLLDSVIWRSDVPVLVGRFNPTFTDCKRLLLFLPLSNLSADQQAASLQCALRLTEALHIPLRVLCQPRYIAWVETTLSTSGVTFEIEAIGSRSSAALARHGQPQDLILVPTLGSRQRFQSSLGRLAETLARRSPASVLILRFPLP